jgi:hypothetical protein
VSPTAATATAAAMGTTPLSKMNMAGGAGYVCGAGSTTLPAAVRSPPTAPACTSIAILQSLSGRGMYSTLAVSSRPPATGMPDSLALLTTSPPALLPAAAGMYSGPPAAVAAAAPGPVSLLGGGLGGRGAGGVRRRRSVGDHVDIPTAAAQLSQRLQELGGAPGPPQQYGTGAVHHQHYSQSPSLVRRRAGQQGAGGVMLGYSQSQQPPLLTLASPTTSPYTYCSPGRAPH